MSANEEQNPYELLSLGIEATDQEIKSAYRRLSLKVHPDRNPNNPDAAQKFHELNQAYELLLDPLRRLALTSSVRAKEARKARFSKYDKKRKDLQDELEERERAFKRQKTDQAKEARAREQENERIKEQGRKMREERAEAVKRQADVDTQAAATYTEDEDEVPPLGHLDTTIKIKYSISNNPSLTTPDALVTLLSQFGSIDSSSIVLSLKPPKKAPTKPPKNGVALVPFRQIGDAFAAVCASGRADRGLEGVEIGWAEGKEPPILGWLKKQGKLDAPKAKPASDDDEKAIKSHPTVRKSDTLFTNASKSAGLSSFSSFPDSFPSVSESTPPLETRPAVAGLDYESLTLMRLRQAERERLERDIREQEAAE